MKSKTTKEEEFTVKGTHLHYFEPHKKLSQQMQKQEKRHQKLTTKGDKRIAEIRMADAKRMAKENRAGLAESSPLILPIVVLARTEKKWNSLAKRLRKRLGV